MIENTDEDVSIVLARVQPELDRLIAAGLVAQIGEEYEFLTGERRSFEEEVTTVEQQYRQEDKDKAGKINRHCPLLDSIRVHLATQQRDGLHLGQPAFACLVCYHKLDADLLEKIRTQYAGPLRSPTPSRARRSA